MKKFPWCFLNQKHCRHFCPLLPFSKVTKTKSELVGSLRNWRVELLWVKASSWSLKLLQLRGRTFYYDSLMTSQDLISGLLKQVHLNALNQKDPICRPGPEGGCCTIFWWLATYAYGRLTVSCGKDCRMEIMPLFPSFSIPQASGIFRPEKKGHSALQNVTFFWI